MKRLFSPMRISSTSTNENSNIASTEAFPYCNTEVVPNDAVYPHCEQTENPTYTNSYYLNGNTPPIGILTATRKDPGSTSTISPGSSTTIALVTSTQSTPSETTTGASSGGHHPSGGAIAGIAVGGAVGLGALALGAFFLALKKKKPTAPTQGGNMAEYTQEQHLQQYAPQAAYGPGYAQGQGPYAPKPYPEQQLAEAPANETVPNVEYRPAWELPASNH
ncbi:hypothetical protein L873DRAFT_1846988 [Choiromyces venosus 120613-1]|uniref:Mid2 domain-containing protein n=1 Tax=Choiromyces venosus 120613-1 TaxID=1336337 RepID=A0A3N4JAX6_9PEZI|nr:hypothetical protein L873DRAFT_1846988 [Choiromyces venosus 120613-1]